MALAVKVADLHLKSATFEAQLDGKIEVVVQASITSTELSRGDVPLEDILLSRSTYVNRGPGLKLVVNVLVDDEAWVEEQRSEFEHSLVNAELWQQLHLRPSLAISSDNDLSLHEQQNNAIVIKLNHDRDFTHTTAKTRHKLADNTPLADVKPPSTVNIIDLTSVKLDLCISSMARQTAKQNLHKSHHHHTGMTSSTIPFDDSCSNASITIMSEESLDFYNAMSTCSLEPIIHDGCCAITDLYQYEEPELGDNYEEERCHSQDTSNQDNFGMPQTSKQAEDCLLTVEPKARISPAAIASLVDCAIRVAIGGSSVRPKFGIKIIDFPPERSLAYLAPAIFNPGYLHAFSQRAVFIPTLSRVFAETLAKNSRSPSLRQKSLQLAGRKPDDPDENKENVDPQSRSLQEHAAQEQVSGHIFTYLQRALHDTAPARKLRPITSARCHKPADTEPDDLLFTTNSDDIFMAQNHSSLPSHGADSDILGFDIGATPSDANADHHVEEEAHSEASSANGQPHEYDTGSHCNSVRSDNGLSDVNQLAEISDDETMLF